MIKSGSGVGTRLTQVRVSSRNKIGGGGIFAALCAEKILRLCGLLHYSKYSELSHHMLVYCIDVLYVDVIVRMRSCNHVAHVCSRRFCTYIKFQSVCMCTCEYNLSSDGCHMKYNSRYNIWRRGSWGYLRTMATVFGKIEEFDSRPSHRSC